MYAVANCHRSTGWDSELRGVCHLGCVCVCAFVCGGGWGGGNVVEHIMDLQCGKQRQMAKGAVCSDALCVCL